MNVAVIGSTLNTYYGIEQIAKYHKIKALFALPPDLGLKKARYTNFEDQVNRYNFDIFYDEHNLKDENVVKKFKDLSLDLIIELGSSKIIPKEVIETAKCGCIGSHGGKLPYIRGGASMNWAIINGEDKWGVSLYHLTPDVDEGMPIETIDFNIELKDDINTVHNKSDLAVGKMLDNYLKDFKPGEKQASNLEVIKIPPSPKEYNWQEIVNWNRFVKSEYKKYKYSEKAIFLPQRKPQDGFIDWGSSSLEIYNFIRAQTGPFFPGAFTLYNNKKLFILESETTESFGYKYEIEPGKIIEIYEDGILIKTLDNILRIKRVRLEGLPEMWTEDFSYEKNLEIGDVLGR